MNLPAMMMLGLVGTMIMQSSSAFTAIVVAELGSGIIEMKAAIAMIMGSNVGTTITSTLVSTFHWRDKEKLRKAVAASSMHDFFNWATMILFLPLEYLTEKCSGSVGMLQSLVKTIVPNNQTELYEVYKFKLTDQFCEAIVKVS